MKKFFVIYLLMISGMLFAQNEPDNVPYIEVTGESQTEVMPDKIYLEIDASDTKNIKVNDVEAYIFKVLEKNGIAKDKLSLVSTSGEAVEYWFKKDDFSQSKKYQLILKNTRELSDVLDDLERKGIDKVNLVKTEVNNDTEVKNKLLADALKAAILKADKMLEVTGNKRGKLLIVRENNVYVPQPLYKTEARYVRAGSEMGASDKPVAELKKIMYKATVYVKIAID